jgi:hypothetical protein
VYLHTYVRRKGTWQLMSSAMYRDPKDGRAVPNTRFPHDPWEAEPEGESNEGVKRPGAPAADPLNDGVQSPLRPPT